MTDIQRQQQQPTRHLLSAETLDRISQNSKEYEWTKLMPGEEMGGVKDVAVYEQSRGGDSAINGSILYKAIHYIHSLRQLNPTEPWKVVRNTVILIKYEDPQPYLYKERLIQDTSHHLCGIVVHEEPFQVVTSLNVKDEEDRWYYLAETETSKAKHTLFLLRSSFNDMQHFKSGQGHQTMMRIENFSRTDFL